MEPTVSIDDNIIYYFTNFHLFSEEESKLLCNYKFFIENMIMKLGEDWRIQSNLLAQEIVTIRTEEHPEKDLTDFSLFNQFLSGYLKGKIGKEYEFTNFCETQIQKEFLQTVNDQFPEQKIYSGLTFKTLSLGYCITACEVWNKSFKNPPNNNFKSIITFKPFGKLCKIKVQEIPQIKNENKSNFETSTVRRRLQNIDIMSSHFSNSENGENKQQQHGKVKSQWFQVSIQQFSERQLKQMRITLQKIHHSLGKTQILSYFVSCVDELHLKDGKKVRIFSISNEFYINAFIIWLIFNIKMFFSLNFTDYLRYFKELMNQNWKQEYERPLKKFQIILEREWNKLLKDFTVALHDDQQVLNILVQRVRKCIQDEWQSKIVLLKQSFSKSIG